MERDVARSINRSSQIGPHKSVLRAWRQDLTKYHYLPYGGSHITVTT